jgi:hypothetical protein
MAISLLENPSEITPGPNKRAVSELKNSILDWHRQTNETIWKMMTKNNFIKIDN